MSRQEMEEMFLNRCRACAELQKSSEKMVSLFEQNLSDMFTRCTSLLVKKIYFLFMMKTSILYLHQIASCDSLPSHLCLDCFGQLSNFNEFRQSCVNSDAYFREYVQFCDLVAVTRFTHFFYFQIISSIKVERLDEIGLKCEESEPNREIKLEIYESECNDASFTQYDSESNVQSPAASSDIPNPIDHSDPFDNTKYICDYCGQAFDRKSHIGSHMTKHKKEMLVKSRPKTFICSVEGCSKVLETRKLFNSHRLKVHKIKPEPAEGEKRVKLYCPKCPKWCTIQHKLDSHIRAMHEGLKVI